MGAFSERNSRVGSLGLVDRGRSGNLKNQTNKFCELFHQERNTTNLLYCISYGFVISSHVKLEKILGGMSVLSAGAISSQQTILHENPRSNNFVRRLLGLSPSKKSRWDSLNLKDLGCPSAGCN